MTGLFYISFVFLWGLAVFETILLREILRKTIFWMRVYSDFQAAPEQQLVWHEPLPTGSPAPSFTARLLGTNDIVSNSGLRGRSSLLLFVHATEETSPSYETLHLAVHAMLHKTDGNMYIICGGTEETCRRLAAKSWPKMFSDKSRRVLLDEDMLIARTFGILRTPHAVIVDEEGRVTRHGYPTQALIPAERAMAPEYKPVAPATPERT